MDSIYNFVDERVLKLMRHIFLKIRRKKQASYMPYEYAQFKGQAASDLIKHTLEGNRPCMIARFGSTELKCVEEYCNSKKGVLRYLRYINGDIDSVHISRESVYRASNNAGIFPADVETISTFSKMMLKDMQEVDILGSWLKNEAMFDTELSAATKVQLPDLEPYYHESPWSACLEGKTVLVVHPFTDTIEAQYKHNRENLFSNPKILPKFSLKILKAVQSIAGQPTGFATWFEALDHMKECINQADFDIAIIGCGAYGFPLAAHVKRLGKKSVHLGGATQLLFGIKGQRWEEHAFISQLFNDHWVYPNANETPAGHQKVENGCYW